MNRISQLAMSDEGFVFNPTTGDSFTVNTIGIFIMRTLKTNGSRSHVLDQLTKRYDLGRDDAERDISEFLDQLALFHLI